MTDQKDPQTEALPEGVDLTRKVAFGYSEQEQKPIVLCVPPSGAELPDISIPGMLDIAFIQMLRCERAITEMFDELSLGEVKRADVLDIMRDWFAIRQKDLEVHRERNAN